LPRVAAGAASEVLWSDADEEVGDVIIVIIVAERVYSDLVGCGYIEDDLEDLRMETLGGFENVGACLGAGEAAGVRAWR